MTSLLQTTAYYDRHSTNDVNGFFTVTTTLGSVVVEQFSKIPSRSGQPGFKDSWTRKRSPIPLSGELKKDLYLWIPDSTSTGNWPVGSGIGEFWNISTEDDKITIKGFRDDQIRTEIGTHPENAYVGSAGCIVHLCESEEQKQRVIAMRNYLVFLKRTRNIEKIKLITL